MGVRLKLNRTQSGPEATAHRSGAHDEAVEGSDMTNRIARLLLGALRRFLPATGAHRATGAMVESFRPTVEVPPASATGAAQFTRCT